MGRRDGQRDEPTRRSPVARYSQGTSDDRGVRRGVIYSALAFSCLIAALIFFAARNPKYRGAQARSRIDARVGPTKGRPGVLSIASSPPGATVVVNGHRKKEMTPCSFLVTSDIELTVKLFLDGYRDFETTILVGEDEERTLVQTLADDMHSR